MTALQGRLAVVTGGTDGMGAASVRALAAAGADVVAIGRSPEKARALEAEIASMRPHGTLRMVTSDFSLMRNVADTMERLAADERPIDLLLNAVGILITRPAWTPEGIELDFAVSYLSRFAVLEDAARLGLLHDATRMVNIAASSPRIPRYARMEFHSIAEVEARTGMKGHGQAQLANDLLTAAAPTRYGITAIGYGPGAVDTSIRRETPAIARALMKPFYALRTRTAVEAAADIVAALTDPAVAPGSASFRNRTGEFPTSDFIADASRQQDLLTASEVLLAKARSAA